jgi:hypothetical protein
MPTWVLSISLALMSMLLVVAGMILDSVACGRAEHKRLLYLAIAPLRGKRVLAEITPAERRTAEGRRQKRAA